MAVPALEPLPPNDPNATGDPAIVWPAMTPGQRRAFIEQYARSKGYVPVSLPVDYYSDVPPALQKIDDGVSAATGPTTDGSSPLGLSLADFTLPNWWLYALAAVLVLGALAVHHRRA